MRRLGRPGAGAGVGSGQGAVGARAYLESLAALEGGSATGGGIEVGMRGRRGGGRGRVGSEAGERSKAGADVGEGGRGRGRGRWRGLWGRKPVVEGEAGDVGGDGPGVVEVGLGADDVDEEIGVGVFPELEEPAVDVVEGGGVGDVVEEESRIGAWRRVRQRGAGGGAVPR